MLFATEGELPLQSEAGKVDPYATGLRVDAQRVRFIETEIAGQSLAVAGEA